MRDLRSQASNVHNRARENGCAENEVGVAHGYAVLHESSRSYWLVFEAKDVVRRSRQIRRAR